jgi:hypothetical protein
MRSRWSFSMRQRKMLITFYAQSRQQFPQPHDAPFDIDTFEPIDPPWPAISEWISADENDPLAVFPEDIVSTHWVPKEIRLDDERTLVLDIC